MRLFTAISLPDAFIEEFNQMISTSRLRGNLNWTKPQNLHITTCFIGETDEPQIDSKIDKIKAITENTAEFRLDFRNILLAPPKNKPYMLWASYNSNESYFNLCAQLDKDLLDFSKKYYFPHVTLARYKGFLKFDSYQIKNTFPSIEVKEMGIWKSELSKYGPTYEKLEDFPLKN